MKDFFARAALAFRFPEKTTASAEPQSPIPFLRRSFGSKIFGKKTEVVKRIQPFSLMKKEPNQTLHDLKTEAEKRLAQSKAIDPDENVLSRPLPSPVPHGVFPRGTSPKELPFQELQIPLLPKLAPSMPVAQDTPSAAIIKASQTARHTVRDARYPSSNRNAGARHIHSKLNHTIHSSIIGPEKKHEMGKHGKQLMIKLDKFRKEQAVEKAAKKKGKEKNATQTKANAGAKKGKPRQGHYLKMRYDSTLLRINRDARINSMKAVERTEEVEYIITIDRERAEIMKKTEEMVDNRIASTRDLLNRFIHRIRSDLRQITMNIGRRARRKDADAVDMELQRQDSETRDNLLHELNLRKVMLLQLPIWKAKQMKEVIKNVDDWAREQSKNINRFKAWNQQRVMTGALKAMKDFTTRFWETLSKI